MEEEFPEDILVVQHHYSDAFAIPWVGDRRSLYGVFGQPSVLFDGQNRIDGASSCLSATTNYRNAIEARLDETTSLSPVSINGQFLAGDTTLDGDATFTLIDPVALGSARAFILVIEDNVDYQGTTYHQISRAAHEEDVLLIDQDDQALVPFSIPVDPTWVLENLRVVAFLQKTSGDLEVHQTGLLQNASSVPLGEDPGFLTRIESVGPNPFYPQRGAGEATIRLQLSEQAAHAPVTLEIVDLQGRRVSRILDSQLVGGASSFAWDGRDAQGVPVEAGVFYVKLATGDGLRKSSVVVLQ